MLLLYSQYRYCGLSKQLLFVLLQDTHKEVHLIMFSIELQQLFFFHVLY